MNISFESVLGALFVLAPQFYTTDPTILAGYQSLYNLLLCQINQQILSCCGVMAMAFLMAFYLTNAANPNIGIQDSLTEDKLSIKYNVSADMQALYLNPYGRMYADLIRRTVVGSFVSNLPPQFGGVIQGMPVGCGCGNYGYGGGFFGPGFGGCGC